jgi:hypothetical protein
MSSTTNTQLSVKYNRWVGVEQARREFVPAFKSSWPYTLVGLTVGALLFLLQHHLNEHYDKESLGLLLLEHLGVGFWVSAIAVFFYEWGAHIKKTLELSEMLAEVLTLKAGDALNESLLILLGNDRPSLREKVAQFVENISHLQSQTTWVGDGYLGVVEWLLDEVVLDNVKSFQKLEGGTWQPFTVPPTAGEMADQILAAQMRVMRPGDDYNVISDVKSWYDGGLETFIKASSTAIIKEGVTVKRVFNLFRLDLPEKSEPAYNEICRETIEILEKHLEYAARVKASQTGGRYEIKIFWDDELKELKGREKRYRDKAKTSHFGLFSQNKPPGAITCFKVEEPDLSDMLLSWDFKVIEPYEKLFKIMWKVSTPLSETIERVKSKLTGAVEQHDSETGAESDADYSD